MNLWMVRAGKHGEQEQVIIDNNVVAVGWNDLPDLSKVGARKDLSEVLRDARPSAQKTKVGTEVGQLWRFVREIKVGDLVGVPLKTQASIAIGEVVGDYQYRTLADNVKHVRPVKWLKTIPRSAFDQDILFSFGSLLTVCKIERNGAESRVRKMVLQGADVQPAGATEEPEETIDVEEYARDQIVKHIGARFKGHDLARLVNAILQAQGYVTRVSPPGPDGGVDILAASGPLGFEKPWLCVQVKSTSSPVDVRILRELQGVMAKVRAEQGLLVSWGGFNRPCGQEANDAFFSTRLWDQGKLLEYVFRYFDKFDDEMKAELPLKRIYALVVEE